MDEAKFRPSFGDAAPESRISDYTRRTPLEEARRSLETDCPDLRIESMEFLAQGMGNDVFIVNGKDLFRFSKKEEGSESMAREMKLLPELAQHLSAPIPRFEWAKKLENGNAKFVGYAMLSGEHPKERDAYNAAGVPDAALAGQFGQFFTELHGFDAEKARGLGIPERDYRAHYERQLRDYHAILFPMLKEHFPDDAEALIARIEEEFAWYFGEPKNFNFSPALLHGDLENENMLIDPRRKTITGVLDWGGAHLGDPDFDLWRPYVNLKKGFMDEVLKTYAHPDHDYLYRKLRFFASAQGCFKFMRAALVEGIESGRAKRRFQGMREKLLEDKF